MKNLLVLVVFISIFVASCIPSLHPIYTEQNRITDDRIIGTWSNATSEKSYTLANNLKVEMDSSGQKRTLKKDEIVSDLFDDNISYWSFNKAVNINYHKQNENSNSNISFTNRSAREINEGLVGNGFVRTITDTLPHYILHYKEIDGDEVSEETVIVNVTKINGHTYLDFSPYTELNEANFFSFNYVLAHTFAKIEFKDDGIIIRPFNSEYIEDLIKQKRVRLKHELVDDQVILTASTKELRAFIAKYGNDSELYLEGDLMTTI